MRIMTYNLLCWGKDEHVRENRVSMVLEMIKHADADSFGVQEATPLWMKDLRENLADYECVGVGRDDGKDLGEHSAVFYKKDMFNLLDSGTFWLSDTPDVPSKGWDGDCTRICTYAVLENKKSKEKHAHVNTHLDHIGPIARTNGVKLVLDKAESFDMPAVITGDFNLDEGCELYKELTGRTFRDTKHLADKTDDGATFNAFDAAPGEIIDYVLVSPDYKVDTYHIMNDKINGQFPSDHYPVYADIK